MARRQPWARHVICTRWRQQPWAFGGLAAGRIRDLDFDCATQTPESPENPARRNHVRVGWRQTGTRGATPPATRAVRPDAWRRCCCLRPARELNSTELFNARKGDRFSGGSVADRCHVCFRLGADGQTLARGQGFPGIPGEPGWRFLPRGRAGRWDLASQVTGLRTARQAAGVDRAAEAAGVRPGQQVGSQAGRAGRGPHRELRARARDGAFWQVGRFSHPWFVSRPCSAAENQVDSRPCFMPSTGGS